MNHVNHDPDAWLQHFRRAAAARDGGRLRSLRRDVFLHTVATVRGGGYAHADGSVALARGNPPAAAAVFHHESESLRVPAALRGRFATAVAVHENDFLAVAARLLADGGRVAVLNMASRRNPGGGVLTGAGAQEENLFRRSDAFRFLYPFADYARDYDLEPHPADAYPIPRESGGIFAAGVTVFRSTEDTGYAFLPQPYRVDVVTVPAISRPDLIERDGRLRLPDDLAAATLVKIRAILRIAAHHGATDLVLSAFGCGAFRNPPEHIAELFRAALGEDEFAGVFRRVEFAILDDHNAALRHNPEGNYLPFARVFEDCMTPGCIIG